MPKQERPRLAPTFGNIATGNYHRDNRYHHTTTVVQNCSIFAHGTITSKRKCAHNTAQIFTTDGAQHIVFHRVPVVSFYPDGEIIVRHNGFQTATTANRITRYLEGMQVMNWRWRWQLGESQWGWSKLRKEKECPRLIDWPDKIHAIYISDYFPDYGQQIYPTGKEPARTYPRKEGRSILMLDK